MLPKFYFILTIFVRTKKASMIIMYGKNSRRCIKFRKDVLSPAATLTFFVLYEDERGLLPGPEGLTVAGTGSWDYRHRFVAVPAELEAFESRWLRFPEKVLERTKRFACDRWVKLSLSLPGQRLWQDADTWYLRSHEDARYIQFFYIGTRA